MRKLFQLSLACLLSMTCLGLSSCGSDDNEDAGGDVNGDNKVIMRSCSLEEGAEVNAKELTVITLSYNTKVTVVGDITLNGQAVEAGNGDLKMKVDVNVKLEDGTSYELHVPAGAIVSDEDKNCFAPEFKLTFKTKETPQSLDNDATRLTKTLGWGWNLGNHFDSYDGGNEKDNYRITWSKDCPYWDNANPTESLYKNLAKAGAKTVRMPVTWGPYEDMTDGNYTIDANYMAVVKQNVLWAKEAGLNVILNTHHDEYWQDAYTASSNPSVNTETKARLAATWTQIAEAFKDEGDFLILEAFNELNHNWAGPTSGELRIQNEWNQLVVDVIRATGGENATRWIAVPSYQANIGYALKADFKVPTDAANKIIVAVHNYDPYNFTLANPLTEAWGHNANSINDEKNIEKTLNQLYDNFISKGIPCYLGEYGCSAHTTALGQQCREYYLEYFCRAAYFAGLSMMLWDNNVATTGSESHGYFNHKDGSFVNNCGDLVSTMVKAATSDDPNYTLQSIYEKAPKK